MHWHNHALGEVDLEASCSSKGIEDGLQSLNVGEVRADEQKRVGHHWEALLKRERVMDAAVCLDHCLQKVDDDEEEVRRQRVTLAKAAMAGDPRPETAVDNHHRLGRHEDVNHPGHPHVRETSSTNDRVEALPTYGIEGFGEIKLEGEYGHAAAVAALHQFGARAPSNCGRSGGKSSHLGGSLAK